MTSMQDAMGRDLHHLGVRGDLVVIAHELVNMGWTKPSLLPPEVQINGGVIAIHQSEDPRVVAQEISQQINDQRRTHHQDMKRRDRR